MTTVRGITSRVDFIWSSNGITLQHEGINGRDFAIQNLDVYSNTYTISSLSIKDDGRTFYCEVIIDSDPPVTATSNITLRISFSAPEVNMVPSGPIQGALVGSPQDIQCTVSTVSGVELSSVMISWVGPGGGTIRNDSRVTISPTSGSGNNYTSSLHFTYLMEGDESTYICDVTILGSVAYNLLEISSLSGKFDLLLFSMLMYFLNGFIGYYRSSLVSYCLTF